MFFPVRVDFPLIQFDVSYKRKKTKLIKKQKFRVKTCKRVEGGRCCDKITVFSTVLFLSSVDTKVR